MAKKIKHFNLESWLMNGLRSICRRYPPIYNKRNEGKITYYITSKNGKQMKRVKHICSLCNKEMKNDEVRIDHIDPIVPVTGKTLRENGKVDWNPIIDAMFCDSSNLQKCCHTCHSEKSRLENLQRKELRDKK